MIEQRLSLITLGVEDLGRARAFYEGALGWRRTGEDESIAFYNVGGMIVALFPHGELAEDIGVRGTAPQGGYHGFTLALNLGSREQVDGVFADLEEKGVTILKRPHAAVWGGYSGYFADADGHAWEVAHNPFWNLDADGRPVAPGGRSERH